MKLLVTRPMTARATAALQARFEVAFRDDTPMDATEARAAMQTHDAILPTLGDDFGAAAFQGELRCKVIANFGAGTNHIDLDAARAAGIAVTNTPDVVTDATADIALMLMLMTLRRASEGERLLRDGNWIGWRPTQLLGQEMTGRRVGIVGMGRIGKAIARRCHLGFGMEVQFFNRSTVSSLDIPARQVPQLRDMLRMCDIAVLAVPGGAATRHLIGRPELEALGPEGYLVNIARGDVVDEDALIAALHDRTIAGAGLDVYAREPDVPQALLDAPNATLLPHLGTATDETRSRMGLRAMENLLAVAEGRNPPDRVA
ncbi:D-glycerate dehydrogenase [Paracoccus sp. 1_MG-2023]|uniref:2-hydroxyacid dehydrogenase n=1 Tax=unclassified Paracoccus (in: a-proteobacteria) TaxID=2688777 RepID=UPI001C095239|nr:MULTISPECIES: D-glycerate dehydrogenase [unclassified Paracoccus (in: a-proteobacteria)]MBU2958137.1 D-glycerate dehydrogenase [Paracoccus sp. C2R09]MDO6669277.1 D-glycerate dehydrogenase [Paracoccus sp. 1_MG-2023]